jgi:hypothetical protein
MMSVDVGRMLGAGMDRINRLDTTSVFSNN